MEIGRKFYAPLRASMVVKRRKPRNWRSYARDAPGVSRVLVRLGKRVRQLRLDCGLTQEQAAARAKLDDKHWQDVESVRTNPTLATLVGVARALGVSLGDLFQPPRKK